MGVRVMALVSLLAVACGDDDSTVPASDAAVTGDAATNAPTAPTPPALPILLPCPDGWRTVTLEGVDACEPFPDTGEADCTAIDEAHFPGEPGCTTVGTPCSPTDDFATDLPSDRPVVFVAPGGTGDGTRAAPYGRIRDGARSPGTVTALAKGTYMELVTIGPDATVWGACVAETVLTTTLPSDRGGVVTASTSDAEVRNLRIGPAPRQGIYLADPGRSLHVEGVTITEAVDAAVLLLGGAAVSARDVVVRDTQPATGGGNGRGFDISTNSTADLSRVAVERCRDMGVLATRTSTLTLADSVVRDTDARLSDLDDGRGLWVREGSTATVDASVFTRNRVVQVYTAADGSSLTFERSVVRDGRPHAATGLGGRGLGVELMGMAEVSRSRFELNRGLQILVAEGSTLRLADTLVRQGAPEDGDGGTGGSRALGLQYGGTATVSRVLVADAVEIGIHGDGEGTAVDATDLTVVRVAPDMSTGTFGFALGIQMGARATVDRAVLDAAHGVALFTTGSATAGVFNDVLVRDTRPRPSDDFFGIGISVQLGASVEARRMSIEQSRHTAAFVIGGEARLSATDFVVRDVTPPPCDDPECASAMGLGVYADATATIGAFEIGRAEVCGLQIDGRSSLDLVDGEVHGCTIGACVQIPDYDVTRLTDGVSYRDNGTNLDATALPVPSAVDSLPTP